MKITKRILRGFTLMELMIMLVIIGIISAFAFPQYSKTIGKMQVAPSMANLLRIYSANAAFKAKHGVNFPYPKKPGCETWSSGALDCSDYSEATWNNSSFGNHIPRCSGAICNSSIEQALNIALTETNTPNQTSCRKNIPDSKVECQIIWPCPSMDFLGERFFPKPYFALRVLMDQPLSPTNPSCSGDLCTFWTPYTP